MLLKLSKFIFNFLQKFNPTISVAHEPKVLLLETIYFIYKKAKQRSLPFSFVESVPKSSGFIDGRVARTSSNSFSESQDILLLPLILFTRFFSE